MIDSTGATDEELRWLSPAYHRTRNPVLVQIADNDLLVDTAQQFAWAERAPASQPRCSRRITSFRWTSVSGSGS